MSPLTSCKVLGETIPTVLEIASKAQSLAEDPVKHMVFMSSYIG